MSLLDQLVRTRSKLKSTATLVTRADGTQIVENHGINVQVVSKSPGFVVDTAPDNVPACIIDNLYLGSQDCADASVLTQYSIVYVLSIGVNPYEQGQPAEVTCKFVPFLDLPDSNILDILQECFEFIDAAIAIHANILVHCNAGVSRSASAVIAYLIRKRRMAYLEAYAHVKNARASIRPNDGFLKQLQQLADNV